MNCEHCQEKPRSMKTVHVHTEARLKIANGPHAQEEV
jgi:hypothetical protein